MGGSIIRFTSLSKHDGWGSRTALLALLTYILAVAGCGSPYDSSVSGTVTLDGQPLTIGTVTFFPDQSGPVA